MKRKAEPIRVDDRENDEVLLLWTKRFSALYQPLSLNIVREVCGYFGFQLSFVPAISKTTLNVYDVKTRTVATCTLPVEFTAGAVFCFINQHLVVSVGGYPECTAAYLIDVTKVKVTEIAPMQKARAWPGIYGTKRYLYVFGGGVPKVKSSEKLTISTTTWSTLPSMNEARYSFTPVPFEGKLYLLDACSNSKSMETFSLLTETFQVLPVHLPGTCGTNSSSIVIDGEYIFLSDCLVRWKINSDKVMRREQLNTCIDIRAYSPTPPLLYSGLIYLSNFEKGQLVCVDLASNRMMKKTSFRTIWP